MPASSTSGLYAPDGTTFDPVFCRRAGGYWIGQKGAEIKVNDYSKALALLLAMSRPRWRRPNKKGNWGLVTGRRR